MCENAKILCPYCLTKEIDPAQAICSACYSKEDNLGWDYSYTQQVINRGQPLRAIDTTEFRNKVEKDRQIYFNQYYSLLLYPIRYQTKTIGVIVIASFSKFQQHLLVEKQDRLMDYLACTAELIELKLEQEEYQETINTMNQQLNLIGETVQDGILLYSDSGIEWMNGHAKKLLMVDHKQVFSQIFPDIKSLATDALTQDEELQREIYYTDSETSVFLTLKAIPLHNARKNVLCMIMPFAQLQNTILQNDTGELCDHEIIAASPEMRQLVNQAMIVAKHDSNVLILGESGTGKEMLARMIHSCSNRKNGPFVSINCAAIPESLLESELFGYEEGAFTGASKGGRVGKFILANSGTLFLDEIGDMPLYLQAKLLRVLSERKVDRIGGSRPIDIDVRILSATNQDLESMVESKRFREDLYYRLNVVPLYILPLRKRKLDIIPLAKHFIQKYNKKLHKDIKGMSTDALETLYHYQWPGNVRELENCLEYMMNFESGDYLTRHSMPPKLLHPNPSEPVSDFSEQDTSLLPDSSLKAMLHRYELRIFQNFLFTHQNKPSLEEIDEFCKTLQISRATYYRKLQDSQI